jgi:hypothetical protein
MLALLVPLLFFAQSALSASMPTRSSSPLSSSDALTYTITLHNDTALAFTLVFSELDGSVFDAPPSQLKPHSDLSLSLTSVTSPSAIIRFYQDARPSFSLVLIGNNAYTSYCKDKPSAYQQGMYCKLAANDLSIDLSILADTTLAS